MNSPIPGVTHLPAYRLYRLDGVGKIVGAEWVAADADDEALDHARQQADGGPFELWERGRLIGSAPARPPRTRGA